MSDKIIYYTSLDKLAESTVNLKNIYYIKKIIALKTISRLLSIEGPINRFDDNFAHNFQYTSIPKDYQTNLSFDDVSIEAAQNIWRSANGKKVHVLWSGGIDSTVALVSLIQTNDNWKNDLVIYTSKYSIEQEYPFFYNSFIKDNIEIKLLQDDEYFEPDLYRDKIVVEGTCGDQIWGCNIIQHMMDFSNTDYKNLYKKEIFQKHLQSTPSIIINYIENLVDAFPVKIKTVANLFWLLTFVHKWDVVAQRHLSFVDDINCFGKMTNFFNTNNYQRWSMTNMDLKIGKTWNTYKQPAKDFIFKFTGDNDYRINKLQHESLGHSVTKSKRTCVYDIVTINDYKSIHNFSDVLTIMNGCLRHENNMDST